MEPIFIILSWAILLVSGFDDSDPPTGDKTFKVEYSDVVQSIKTTSDATLEFWGFEIELKQNSVGILDVKIPINFPTPASFTNSWNFGERPSVIADNKEIDYDFVKEPCFLHYKIPVEGEKNVEITYPVITAGKWQLHSSIQFDENNPCYDKVFYEPAIKSPLKQFKSGIKIDDIKCKGGLQLIFKVKNGSPACVKSETSIKLIMSGWAKNIFLSNHCTEAYPNGLDTFEQPFSRTSPKGLVFFMKSNSTANICVRYTSPYDNTGMEQVYAEMWTGKGNYEPALSSEIVVSANPGFLPLNRDANITETYTITALNNSKGIYWISVSQICELIPVVVGIDNSEISSSDIPVFLGFHSCPASSLNSKIIGVSDAKVDYKIRQPIGEP